jgi:hypothetical protein
MHRLLKRAILSTASAFGIKPVDRKWIAALTGLNGTFERTGSELGVFVAILVFLAGMVLAIGGFGIRVYSQSGRSAIALLFSAYGLGMSCLLGFLVSRARLRYVFEGGMVSAYNTWGRLMWSENLAGIKDITFLSGHAQTSMTLFWPDRKRALVLFDSLKNAVDDALGRGD